MNNLTTLYNYYCDFEEQYNNHNIVEYLKDNRYLLHRLFEATLELEMKLKHNYEDYRKFIVTTYNHDMYSLWDCDELNHVNERRA